MMKDAKTVALVTLGVIVAGWILNYGEDIELIKTANKGYN